MAALRQLQLRYDAVQDRILLRTTTQADEEFRFWLTRRYCALLLGVLSRHHALDPDVATGSSPEARRAVAQFKQEAATAGTDFDGDFREAAVRPLGDAPMLAYRLTYRAGEAELRLEIAPQEGTGITVTLDAKLSRTLKTMLEQAIRAGDWRLVPAAPATVDETKVLN